MNERVGSAVSLVTNYLMVQGRSLDDTAGIFDTMETLGYEEGEISAALHFIEGIPAHSGWQFYGTEPFRRRPLHLRLADILTSEARNILILMEQFHILDAPTVDDVLDRVEMAYAEQQEAVDLDEMKGIINSVIMDNLAHGVDDMIRMAAEKWGRPPH